MPSKATIVQFLTTVAAVVVGLVVAPRVMALIQRNSG